MKCLDGVTDSTTFEQTPGDGKGQGTLAAAVNGVKRAGHDLATEQQQDLCTSGSNNPINFPS